MFEYMKKEFPFWSYEIKRLERYLEMLEDGSLPLAYVLGVVKNYLIIADKEDFQKDLENLHDELQRRYAPDTEVSN